MKKRIKTRWSICLYLVLVAFTVYISLDTFVIGRNYISNATEENTAMFENLEAQGNSAESEMPENRPVSEGGAESEKADLQNQSNATEGNGRPESSENINKPPSEEKEKRSAADAEQGKSQEPSSENSEETSSEEKKEEQSNRRSFSSNRNTRNNQSQNNQGFGQSAGRAAWESSGQADGENSVPTGIGLGEYSGDAAYQDDTVSIQLSEYNELNTTIYVADVTVSSAQYLKTAFANDTYGKNITATTSAIAQANDAILAINGDYYGAQEKGYVIRNGIIYRDTPKGTDVLCIYADGTMGIVNDREYTAEQLVETGVWQCFSFGPALVENGTVTVGASDSVGREMASNPRTAIGVMDANHFLFVVSDGRTDESEGLSLYELAEFMQKLGVETAYNLDGGGSSTLYFNGEVINNPTTTGRIQERKVSDIVYIGQST